MSIFSERDKRFAANSIFPSFFYAVLAMVLGQVGAADMHGSWRLHVFLSVPGLVLSGLALFRARLHWAAARTGMPALNVHNVGWYLLLFAIGTFIGVLTSVGSILLLGIAATLMYLCPWMKIPVCRARFVVSSLVMLAGTIAWVLADGKSVQSPYLLMATWILYLPSMLMYLLVLLSLDLGYRIEASRLTDQSCLDAHVPFSPGHECVPPDGRIQ